MIANYSDKEVKFVVPNELSGKESKLVMSSYDDSPKSLNNFTLRPYEGTVYEL